VNRAITRLEELALLGTSERGVDRALATPQERAARELFASWARSNGYALSQDRVGNLFARRDGVAQDAAPILTGSHLDTVPTGGSYDGAYGVVGAICALELLDQRNAWTQHPVEAVAWVGEEGSRFPLGCLGSSVFANVFSLEYALGLEDARGITLHEALGSESGLLQGVPMRNGDAAGAYLELHVEQGPVLEREGVSLGVVTAIAGQRRYRAIVEGESGHAGTVPMGQRHDALAAAAELMLAIERAAVKTGESVATVGRAVVEPNGTNVIPARVTFSVDIRSADDERIDAVERALYDASSNARSHRGVRVRIERLEARLPIPMDAAMRAAIGRAIESLGQRAIDVPSGAGHDAMCLARVAPTGMIFVPSIGGRSHVPHEATSPRDVELGIEALAASILEVDALLARDVP
jgi:hydantoinase/carbamoylase family amidase